MARTSISIEELLEQNADLRQQLKGAEDQVSDLEGRLAEIRGLAESESDEEGDSDDQDEEED